MKRIFTLFLACLMLLGVLAGCGAEEEASGNPAYAKLFEDQGIKHRDEPGDADTTACFAKKDQNGVDVIQVFYRDDTIYAITETIYTDLRDCDEDEKNFLLTFVQSVAEDLRQVTGTTVELENIPGYNRMTVHITQLDDLAVLEEAIAADMVFDLGTDGYVSLAATRESQLADGYIEK